MLNFYHCDFNESSLSSHLQLLGTAMEANNSQPCLQDIEYLKSLTPAQRSIMSEVCTLVKLILVSPATNAVSERSASGLRRIKTYLRSTMSQQRLNSLCFFMCTRSGQIKLISHHVLMTLLLVVNASTIFGQF